MEKDAECLRVMPLKGGDGSVLIKSFLQLLLRAKREDDVPYDDGCKPLDAESRQ